MTTRIAVMAVGIVAALVVPGVAQAQGGGFGIGPRLTFVRGSAELPDGAQRFSGGAIRLGGGKTALEIAMDFRSGITGDLTERIKDYPIQASLLLFPVRHVGAISRRRRGLVFAARGATRPNPDRPGSRNHPQNGLSRRVRR
jgi:hypothetical protein